MNKEIKLNVLKAYVLDKLESNPYEAYTYKELFEPDYSNEESAIKWQAYCQLVNRHKAIKQFKLGNIGMNQYSGFYRESAEKSKTTEETSKEEKEIKKMTNTTTTNNNNGLENLLINALSNNLLSNLSTQLEELINNKVNEKLEEIKRELPSTKETTSTIIIKEPSKVEYKINKKMPYFFESMVKKLSVGFNVMLTGHAGTGKGFACESFCEAFDYEFYQVNAVMNEFALTGFIDANGKYQETEFYRACKSAQSKKALFMFDEFDCSIPDVIKIFNEFLNKKSFVFPNGEELDCKDNLLIVCACNTQGDGSTELYCGNKLDKSTLDRFSLVHTDYDKDVELQITNNNTELVEFYDEFRKIADKNGLPIICSYRSLERITKYESISDDTTENLKDNFIKSLAKDDLQSILYNFNSKENKYYKACIKLVA